MWIEKEGIYMLKSIKNQLIISSIASLLFIIFIFLIYDNTDISRFITNIFIFITISSVFNTGLLTQKYLYSKDPASNGKHTY